MCGIFGIITDREQPLGPILIDAARRLSYRGYDSVGCATLHADRTIDLRKDVGKVDAVAERLDFAAMTGQRGMVQLRWATFGVPSQINAQPHLDSDGGMVGAHNGNVVNNVELRQQFSAEGMTVRSLNDGESCVHAVERHLRRGCDMVEAIRRAYDDLEGDYAFVIARADDDRLYAIKKGSGLVVGSGRRRDLRLIRSALDLAADQSHRARQRWRDRDPPSRSGGADPRGRWSAHRAGSRKKSSRAWPPRKKAATRISC